MRSGLASMLALVLASASAGCSALELFPGPVDVPCTSDGPCAAIPVDPCHVLRCDRAAGFCRAYDHDADGDREAALECADGAPSLPATDCDDLDPHTAAAAEDTCNGRDDDCDLRVDESCVPIDAVSTGIDHSCALRGGEVLCWGSSRSTGVGRGPSTPRVVPGLSDIESLASGGFGACALRRGEVLCWGSQLLGPLPPGVLDGEVVVIALPRPAMRLVVSGATGCAALDDGSVWCWGATSELSGSFPGDGRAFALPGLRDPVALGLSQSHVCAVVDGGVVEGGVVECLGLNLSYACRPDSEAVTLTPALRDDIAGVTQLSLGALTSVAHTADGTVWAWGEDLFRWVDPNGYAQPDATPIAPLGRADAVFLFRDYLPGTTLCVRNGSRHRCVGALPRSTALLEMPFLDGAVDLSLSRDHACALWSPGPIRCWGENANGELGDGTAEDASEPVEVRGI